jgi:hypothetical protein
LQALPVKLPITFASTSAKLQAIPLASSYYSAKKCSMNMHQGHAAMTRRKDMQQVHVAWACSMDKKHGHAALTLAWTCGVYMQQGHESKHFLKTCRIDMQPGHKMLHGYASLTWAYRKDIHHRPKHAARRIRREMQQVHAALKYRKDTHYVHIAQTCIMDMQYVHVARTCSIDR